jgi:GNAT superfamily N-acetyltransferase
MSEHEVKCTFTVENIQLYPQHQHLAAEWSVEEWKNLFPQDTVQTYLSLFQQKDDYAGRLCETFVAVGDLDTLLGLAILLDDDNLPDAQEPGPWLAAVFVTPSARKAGVGSALVQKVTQRAIELCHECIYLYTEDMQQWYARKGWQPLRTTVNNGHAVSVMHLPLSAHPDKHLLSAPAPDTVENPPHSEPANKTQHNLIFAAWLVSTYGQDYLRSRGGVLDVAGGQGLLSFELGVRYGIMSTVVDTRAPPVLKGMLRRKMRVIHRQRVRATEAAGSSSTGTGTSTSGEADGEGMALNRDPLMAFVRRSLQVPADDGVFSPLVAACLDGEAEASLPYDYIRGAFPLPQTDTVVGGGGASALPRTGDASIIVGMHADQATEMIIDSALALGVPFAVVPCCLFKRSFPNRTIAGAAAGEMSGKAGAPTEVATYSQYIQYLRAKDPRIRSAQLPFLGRNTVLYVLPGR